MKPIQYDVDTFKRVIFQEPYFMDEIPDKFKDKISQPIFDTFNEHIFTQEPIFFKIDYDEYGVRLDSHILNVLKYPVSIYPVETIAQFCDVITNALVNNLEMPVKGLFGGHPFEDVTRQQVLESIIYSEHVHDMGIHDLTGLGNVCAIYNWMKKSSEEDLLKDGIDSELKVKLINLFEQSIKSYKRVLMEEALPFINSIFDKNFITLDDLIEQNWVDELIDKFKNLTSDNTKFEEFLKKSVLRNYFPDNKSDD